TIHEVEDGCDAPPWRLNGSSSFEVGDVYRLPLAGLLAPDDGADVDEIAGERVRHELDEGVHVPHQRLLSASLRSLPTVGRRRSSRNAPTAARSSSCSHAFGTPARTPTMSALVMRSSA